MNSILSKAFSGRDVAPADFVSQWVHETLLADSRLRLVFAPPAGSDAEPRIYRVEVLDPKDLRALPALFVSNKIVGRDPVPGNFLGPTTLYIVAVWQQDASPKLTGIQPTVATLEHWIGMVLERDKTLNRRMPWMSEVRNHATRNDSVRTDVQFIPELEGRNVYAFIMERQIESRLDARTGEFWAWSKP